MPDLLLTSNGRTETDEEDYDVTSDGRLVGHIFKPAAAPVETPWMWAFVRSRLEDRFPAPPPAPAIDLRCHWRARCAAAAAQGRVRFAATCGDIVGVSSDE
jgi:hypothetical protein